MGTLTDSSFHHHSFRFERALAVSCGVDCLDSEHVVFPGNQAVAHKPGKSTDEGVKSFTITLDLQLSLKIELLFIQMFMGYIRAQEKIDNVSQSGFLS